MQTQQLATRAMILRTLVPDAVLRTNREFTECFGTTSDELSRRPLLDWIHPEDRQLLQEALEAGAGSVRARHQAGDNEWLPLDWSVKTHSSQVVAMGRSPLAEPEAGTADTADARPPRGVLSETLETMALIVEAKNPGMKCSILLVDHERQCITLGAGPSFPDAYNQAVEGLKLGPAVGSCGTAAFWNVQVIVENIAEDPLWRDLRGAADIAGVLACWSQPIVGAKGDVLGAMALYNDHPRTPSSSQLDGLEIAARMVGLAIEGARHEEQLRLTTKMEALGVLAGGIAHDFNNLLATILGNSELALERAEHDPKTRQAFEAVVTASLRARELCNQMLTYAGQGSVSTEVVECNALVRELGTLLGVTLSKKATLYYDLHREPLGVQVDRSQLGQVIMNLITNASEALGDSEGRVEIASTARSLLGSERELLRANVQLPPGEYVCLEVTDTGEGMNSSRQQRIFDPFYTTKVVGRGLGLAAVQGIMVRHNGAILIDSEPGNGTTMTVLFPRVAVVEEAATSGSRGLDSRRQAHILLADDEPTVLDALIQSLQLAGYSTTSARDGQEAVDLYREQPDRFDCVVLDLSMPRLDGAEAFRELCKIRPDVRVILSSGFSEQDIMERFEGDRPSGVIRKPARRRDFLATVARVLE